MKLILVVSIFILEIFGTSAYAEKKQRVPQSESLAGKTIACQSANLKSRPFLTFTVKFKDEKNTDIKVTKYPFFGAEIAVKPQPLDMCENLYSVTALYKGKVKDIFVDCGADGQSGTLSLSIGRKRAVNGLFDFPEGQSQLGLEEDSSLELGCKFQK